jgi:hypothetical protein
LRSLAEPYVDGLVGKLFFRLEQFGRLRSYVRPFSMRPTWPLALMKYDNQGSDQMAGLEALGSEWSALGFR